MIWDLFFATHEINGNYKWISPEIEGILGYKPLDLIGKNAYDLFYTEDSLRILRTHINTRTKSQEVTYRIRKKDGKYIWVKTFARESNNDDILEVTIKLNLLQIISYRLFGI